MDRPRRARVVARPAVQEARTAFRWIALAIVALGAALVWDQLDAQAEAETFARKVAVEMQAACERDRRCPEPPAEWQVDSPLRSATEVRGTRVDYRVHKDRSGFRVSVYRMVGSILDIEGGVANPLGERGVVR